MKAGNAVNTLDPQTILLALTSLLLSSSTVSLATQRRPIENCWSKLKQYLRTVEARSYEKLAQAITEAINLVTDQDIIGWFTHCCYYVPPN